VAIGGLIILFFILFIVRGWMRVTVIPKTASIFYTNSVKNAQNNELRQLNNPFKTLGATANPKISTSCNLEMAQSIHTEIDCNARQLAYTKLPVTTAGQADIQAQAQTLQTLLSIDGWNGGSNGVTLASLIDGTAKGIDYSPDANYEKVIGNYDCVFDVMIEYANPQPPAVNISLSCDRTLDVLGAPKNEFYISSKGHI
jgi:hypothetical protein